MRLECAAVIAVDDGLLGFEGSPPLPAITGRLRKARAIESDRCF